jgi:hypothetical protein
MRCTYGRRSADVSHEHARMISSDAVDAAKYVLQLSQPVAPSIAGWDDVLIGMLANCASSSPSSASAYRPLLTYTPPESRASGVNGNFPVIGDDDDVRWRPFRVPPDAPVPVLFWTAAVSFGHSEDVKALSRLAASKPSRAPTALRDAQLLWRSECDFFAPHVMPFVRLLAQRTADAPPKSESDDDRDSSREAWGRSARTPTDEDLNDRGRSRREWFAFVGCRQQARDGDLGGRRRRWLHRARLGLTPQATHAERFAKWGNDLAMHAVVAA